MSDFAVKVVEIVDPVTHHPDADRLSLIKVNDYICISAKLEDGSHRYNVGDLVVYVPEGAVVPEYLLKPGFWSEEKGKGILAGSKGDRVKAMRLRGIFSQGILFPVQNDPAGNVLFNSSGDKCYVQSGDDVAEFLGITKYEPPIPPALAGEVTNIHGKTARYDFESIQTVPDLFTVGEEVVVTEKLHGTNCQIGYIPGLNHPELFYGGDIYVASKGLGAQGLVLKNNEKNAGNTYVRILRELLNSGFGDKMKEISERNGNVPVRVFGEIYGAGLQKGFGYGKKVHSFASFDIQLDREYVPYDTMIEIAQELGVPTVPLLYMGPYDLDTLVKFRDGRDIMSGTNLREGIVIKARDGGRHPHHGRKIGKWVSPDYLLKSTGEEFN
jgi:RNA ligase (TIGR02306 family)